VAALASDQGVASDDLGNEKIAIKKSNGDPAAQRCYVLANDVRYAVEQKLDHGARASTSNDAASFQAQLDAKWQELVNLQQYNQDFSNNDVAPDGGAWATAAISLMTKTMTDDAGKANLKIAAVNKDVASGYQQYRLAWSQWNCPVSKLLQEPRPVPLVKVKSLPKAVDP